MAREDLPVLGEGLFLAQFVDATHVDRSRDVSTGVLGGKVVVDGGPTPRAA